MWKLVYQIPDNVIKLSRIALLNTFYFSRYFFQHFYQLRGLQTASSMAYTTLLSIVPLLTVMFGLFGKIAFLQDDLSISIQNFIFAHFVPQFGATVQNYILDFSAKASQLTMSGSVILVVIAILLMATIDNAFNLIWLVKNKRPPVSRLLVYWAVLTMGPLLIGVGLASTSYLLSLPAISDVDVSFDIRDKLLSYLPFLTTSVAFTLLYILVPNCFVPKKHALISGIICAVLFELAKYGFGIYVRTMSTYENIYGSISVIPLFLIWIYVSWVIVLFGAHITFCLSSFRLQDEFKQHRQKDWAFPDVLQILEHLYQAQRAGRTVSISDFRKSSIFLPHYQIDDLLQHLKRFNWVNQSDGRWLLAKDLKETRLYDLHAILPVRLPLTENEFKDDMLSSNLKLHLTDYHKDLSAKLAVPIADLYRIR